MRYIDPDGNFKTKFGAWLNKLFQGGDEILQDKETNEYFVSQEKEYKGDGAGVTVKRRFGWEKRGSKNSERSEVADHRSNIQNDGINFTTSGPVVSPTTTTSRNPVRSINIDNLMPALSKAGAGPYRSSTLDIAKSMSSAVGFVGESFSGNKGTSDWKIKETTTGGDKTNSFGKSHSYDVPDSAKYMSISSNDTVYFKNSIENNVKRQGEVPVTKEEYEKLPKSWSSN